MKKYILLVIATVLIGPWALAQEHEHQGQAQGQGHMMHDQGGQEQMMKLHGNFQHMRDIMANVKKETDPQKRKELLQQHVQLMRESMTMLHGMQNGMMGQMNKDDGKMDMGKMTHQMSMMEDMLRQMEAYSAAVQE